MKKFKITIIIILFAITNGIAQDGLPKDGDNITNDNLNKFVGTWIWSNGTESLKLILKKENVKLQVRMNIRADILYGFHVYIKNGTIIENSTNYFSTTYKDKKSSLFAIGDPDQPNKLELNIRHLSKNKSVNAYTELIDPTHLKIIKLEDYEGIRIGKFDWSISLPQDIILTKQ